MVKVMENGIKKKCLYIVFWLTRRSRVRGKNMFFAIVQHEQQLIACFQTHFDYGPSKIPFKVGTVNFANLLSPPSIVKKVRTGSKNSQGT